MEWNWKEKGTETIFDVAIAFVGGWLVKKGLKSLSPIKTWGKNVLSINKTKSNAQESLGLIMAVIRFSKDPMWIMNLKGEFEHGNPAWCELFGFEEEEDAHFMGWMRIVPDEYIETMVNRNKQFIKHPNNFDGEVILMHIHTKEKIVRRCTTHLIYDENKKPIKSIGILEIIKN